MSGGLGGILPAERVRIDGARTGEPFGEELEGHRRGEQCGTYSESPDWSTGKPDFDNPKVGVNARLLDDFDLDAVTVTVIDGKNLW